MPVINNFRQKIVPLLQGRAFGLPEGRAIVDGGDALLLVCEQRFDNQRLNTGIVESVENVRRRSCNVQRGICTLALASLALKAALLLLHPENPPPLRPKTLPSAPSGLLGSAAKIGGNSGTSWVEPAFMRSAPMSRRSAKTSSQRKPPISSAGIL